MRDLNLKCVINFMLMNQLHILFMMAVFCLFAISFCVNRSWIHFFIYIVLLVKLGLVFSSELHSTEAAFVWKES